jgi:hypothetical protein
MSVTLAQDQREALGMLAASLRGRVESLMQAHGFGVGTLRSLVREGLATADRGPRTSIRAPRSQCFKSPMPGVEQLACNESPAVVGRGSASIHSCSRRRL